MICTLPAPINLRYSSATRKDAERVGVITRLLEDAGASVWRDSDRILGGQYFGEEIVHAIAHSRVLLVMCSPHSFESDNVFREVALTWDYHRRYLPVWLTPPVEIPARLRYALVSPQWVEAHSGPPGRVAAAIAQGALGHGRRHHGSATRSRRRATGPAGNGRPGLRFKPGDRPIAGSDWVLERLLGKGGFGEVWKAHYPHLQQPGRRWRSSSASSSTPARGICCATRPTWSCAPRSRSARTGSCRSCTRT